MKLSEYLLVCFSEELSEIAQETSKCLRFTPHHTPHGVYTTSNLERLQLEVADVCALSHLLRFRCDIETGLYLRNPSTAVLVRFNEKLNRTMALIKISKELGVLDDSDN